MSAALTPSGGFGGDLFLASLLACGAAGNLGSPWLEAASPPSQPLSSHSFSMWSLFTGPTSYTGTDHIVLGPTLLQHDLLPSHLNYSGKDCLRIVSRSEILSGHEWGGRGEHIQPTHPTLTPTTPDRKGLVSFLGVCSRGRICPENVSPLDPRDGGVMETEPPKGQGQRPGLGHLQQPGCFMLGSLPSSGRASPNTFRGLLPVPLPRDGVPSVKLLPPFN